VVSFTPRPPYFQRKSPGCPLDRRLGGSHSRSGRGGEEKNSQTPAKSTNIFRNSAILKFCCLTYIKVHFKRRVLFSHCPHVYLLLTSLSSSPLTVQDLAELSLSKSFSFCVKSPFRFFEPPLSLHATGLDFSFSFVILFVCHFYTLSYVSLITPPDLFRFRIKL
jgi:hypothetical protein